MLVQSIYYSASLLPLICEVAWGADEYSQYCTFSSALACHLPALNTSRYMDLPYSIDFRHLSRIKQFVELVFR